MENSSVLWAEAVRAAQDTSRVVMWEGDFIPQFLGHSSVPWSELAPLRAQRLENSKFLGNVHQDLSVAVIALGVI